MEFLEGESLRTRLDRVQRLPTLDALRLARQLASALVAAHRKNVIHRELLMFKSPTGEHFKKLLGNAQVPVLGFAVSAYLLKVCHCAKQGREVAADVAFLGMPDYHLGEDRRR